MGFFEAWSRWLSGNPVGADAVVWGIRILWWGRLGKLMQFGAALVIVIEIIGPERLRTWGTSLKDVVPVSTAKEFAVNTGRWIIAWLRYSFTLRRAKRDAAYDRMWDFRKQSFAALILGVLYTVFDAIRSFDDVTWWLLPPYVFGTWWIATSFLAPVVMLLVVTFVSLSAYVIDLIAIEPIARLLEMKRLEKLTKVLSLAVLVIGFQFDLLAS